ncbi:MAG: RNA methyltransferase, partial [Anaerolineaceae bacterium]|nr:RNA methyltransferase [Anaerolineaceae bacterium]
MITSLANERIKFLRKLQDRKAREESGLFFLEGLRVVAEAVDKGADLDTLVVSPDLLKSTFGQDLVARQHAQGTTLLEVSSDVCKRLSLKEGPQGLAAVARQRWKSLDDVTFPSRSGLSSRTWVALDSIADPGNLGTILRTHDAVGGEGVILLDQSTDPYDPSAARASMGALFTQTLVKASFAQFCEWKLRAGVAVVGTSGAADIDYAHFRY